MTAPLEVQWRGRLVRIRHDDPALEPLMPRASVIASAMQLASDELGLLRAIEATVGEWYEVRIEPGPVVKLRKRTGAPR